MTKYWIKNLANFTIGTMLNVVFYGLLGFIWNIAMGFMSAGNMLWLYRFFVFVFYWCVLNWWIYGTSNKQRKYLDSLPRDHKVTLKEDYLTFIKQEGLPIIVFYSIGMSLQVFVLGFTKGYFQAFFALLAPIGLEQTPMVNWSLSLVFFIIGYQAVAVLYRRHIRKESYDFLFEFHKKDGQSE